MTDPVDTVGLDEFSFSAYFCCFIPSAKTLPLIVPPFFSFMNINDSNMSPNLLVVIMMAVLDWRCSLFTLDPSLFSPHHFLFHSGVSQLVSDSCLLKCCRWAEHKYPCISGLPCMVCRILEARIFGRICCCRGFVFFPLLLFVCCRRVCFFIILLLVEFLLILILPDGLMILLLYFFLLYLCLVDVKIINIFTIFLSFFIILELLKFLIIHACNADIIRLN